MIRYSCFFLFVLLFFSCKPTLYEIKQIETSLEIKEGKLLVQLRDERENIELLEKYDRPKKAARLEKEMETYNLKLKKAFTQYYDYSDYQFIYQKEWIDSLKGMIRIVNEKELTEEVQSDNLFYATFKKTVERGTDDREFDATTITIIDLTQDVNSFERRMELTTHDLGEYPDFNFLAKFINKQLIELDKRRTKFSQDKE